MENPEPRAQYLNVVLRQIEKSALRIPRFQRHFVWGERNVLDLLGSIENGYPIGSILTWRVDRASQYFSGFREDPFPPADENVSNFEVVLDGAQRLSSLFGCLRNPGSAAIYRVTYDLASLEFLHQADIRTHEAWHVPMDTLFDSRRFLAVQSEITQLDDGEEYLRRALELYSTFQDYQIPIIALSSAVLEDVVEVFRRVNSSGTPLSSVDFVRALTWRSSFDLEETFEDFTERYQGTPLEGLTEDFLVRCLAISSNLSLDARDILQLKKLADREGALANEVEAMREALDRMASFLERFEITGMHEVPYEVQRLLLFGLMHFSVAVSDREIEKWFWRSTFAEEHQSKPESYVSRLVREMRHGRSEQVLEVRRPVEADLLATRVRRSGTAVATGFDLLLRRAGPRSLLSGEHVTTNDVLHGRLFSRQEFETNGQGQVPSAQVLANLVILTASDATEWKTLRESSSLAALHAECDQRTGEADAIWATQGVEGPLDGGPTAVLANRSRVLLGRVVDGLEPSGR